MQISTMSANQNVIVTALPLDSSVPPQIGTLMAGPDWSTDRPDLIQIAPAPNGMTAVLTGKGIPGTAIVTANAQATPFPENLRAITSFTMILTGLPATHFDFTFSTPVNNS